MTAVRLTDARRRLLKFSGPHTEIISGLIVVEFTHKSVEYKSFFHHTTRNFCYQHIATFRLLSPVHMFCVPGIHIACRNLTRTV